LNEIWFANNVTLIFIEQEFGSLGVKKKLHIVDPY